MGARIDIFSDTICPWCYLGKRRFELALAARPQYTPRVTWRPFELNPDLPWDGVARTDRRAKAGDSAQGADPHAPLVRLGVEVGLAGHDTRSAVVLRAGQDGVVAAERHATVLGITGVPTFVFDGKYSISGAQEVATFTRIIDQVVEFAAAREIAS